MGGGFSALCRRRARVLQCTATCAIFHDLHPSPDIVVRGDLGDRGVIRPGRTDFCRLRLRRVWGVLPHEAAHDRSCGDTVCSRGAHDDTTKGRNEMIWQVGLYAAAVLIPLAAFAVEAIFIRQLKRL